MMTVNKKLNTIKSPCINCTHRNAECNGVCDQYKIYKQMIRSVKYNRKIGGKICTNASIVDIDR